MADNENGIEGKVRQLSLFQETLYAFLESTLGCLTDFSRQLLAGEIWTQPNADKSVSLKLFFFLLKFDEFFHQLRIENRVRFTPYIFFAKILILVFFKHLFSVFPPLMALLFITQVKT